MKILSNRDYKLYALAAVAGIMMSALAASATTSISSTTFSTVGASTTNVGSTGAAFLGTSAGSYVGIATSSPVSTYVLTVGTNPSTTAASTTILMGKIQFQGQTSTGATICIFFNGTVAGNNASTTITNGACNQ